MMDKMQNAKTMEKKNVGNDKLRLLAVLKIMQRTDEDHPLTKNQIMNKVVEQGIEDHCCGSGYAERRRV